MVARVVAVLGSGRCDVAVLVQSGRVERAGWLVKNKFWVEMIFTTVLNSVAMY